MKTQRVSMITLSVRDLEKSRTFYTKIGFEEDEGGNKKIAFFKMHGMYFALYSKDALTEDIGMPIHARTTGGVTLSTNYGSPKEVDEAFDLAVKSGAVAITKPIEIFWGGYSGNYTDPDGHLWEVAHNPFWGLAAEGYLSID